jgi:hypothetical protein
MRTAEVPFRTNTLGKHSLLVSVQVNGLLPGTFSLLALLGITTSDMVLSLVRPGGI